MQFYKFINNIDKLLLPFNSDKNCENIVKFEPLIEEKQMGLFDEIISKENKRRNLLLIPNVSLLSIKGEREVVFILRYD